MNVTLNSTTKRLIAAVGMAAAGTAIPALLPLGAGVAHADACYGELQYSYYCSPASGAQSTGPRTQSLLRAAVDKLVVGTLPPVARGGVLAALGGEC
ncbi:hypothetical protein MAUB1S_04408 [Mycolicibacterium aubagnense]